MFKKIGLVVMTIGLLLGFCTVARADYKASFAAGQVKESTKNFAGARADYQTALGLTKNSEETAETQLRIGISYELEKNYAQARIEYARVTKGTSYTGTAQFRTGHTYELEENYPQARIAYGNIKNDTQYTAEGQFYVGHMFLLEGNKAEAEKAYLKLLTDMDFNLLFAKNAFAKIKWNKMDSKTRAVLLLAAWKNIPTPPFEEINSLNKETKQIADDTLSFKGKIISDLYEVLGLPKDAGIIDAEAKIKTLP